MIEALLLSQVKLEQKSWIALADLHRSHSGGLARDKLDAAMAPSRTRGAHGYKINTAL